MKITLLILLILVTIFILFYGGYYLVRPSQKGEEILKDLNLPYPTIIAHRGASNIAPESTEAAFIKAVEMGTDYVEADIHRTKDGKIVVLHDSNLKRTSNVEEIYPDRQNNHISTFTYDELLKLDFGSWFNEKYPNKADEEYNNLKIITLERLLEIAEFGEESTGIVLDLKDVWKYPGIEKDIIEILQNEQWYGEQSKNSKKLNDKSNILIFSFNLETLKTFKELAPSITRVLLLNSNMLSIRRWKRWLDVAEENTHGLAVKGTLTWPWNLALAHNRNLFVFPYVINKTWQLRIGAHIKSSGYITDRPELVLRFLK
ncbi:MAG: glycerophosphodiester phosphodiesterase family protein [Halanaerobiales bacterium]